VEKQNTLTAAACGQDTSAWQRLGASRMSKGVLLGW